MRSRVYVRVLNENIACFCKIISIPPVSTSYNSRKINTSVYFDWWAEIFSADGREQPVGAEAWKALMK